MYQTIEVPTKSEMTLEDTLFLFEVGKRLKKLVKNLIEVKKASNSGGKAFEKAQAKVFKATNEIRSFAAENMAQQKDDGDEGVSVVSTAVNGAVDKILSDFKKNPGNVELKPYKWMGLIADAIPDDAVSDKVKITKRIAKLINDYDEDDDLSDDEVRELLMQNGRAA